MPARFGRAGVGVRTTEPNADGGMVTAELAVALPTVFVVLLAALTGLFAVATELRCTDAAATAARLVARGEPRSTAQSAVRTIAGNSAAAAISVDRGVVLVDVRAPAQIPLLRTLLHLPSVSARFRQPLEPGVTP